jgi:hypothetical protein
MAGLSCGQIWRANVDSKFEDPATKADNASNIGLRKRDHEAANFGGIGNYQLREQESIEQAAHASEVTKASLPVSPSFNDWFAHEPADLLIKSKYQRDSA